jgi:hypothetical protein
MTNSVGGTSASHGLTDKTQNSTAKDKNIRPEKGENHDRE